MKSSFPRLLHLLFERQLPSSPDELERGIKGQHMTRSRGEGAGIKEEEDKKEEEWGGGGG